MTQGQWQILEGGITGGGAAADEFIITLRHVGVGCNTVKAYLTQMRILTAAKLWPWLMFTIRPRCFPFGSTKTKSLLAIPHKNVLFIKFNNCCVEKRTKVRVEGSHIKSQASLTCHCSGQVMSCDVKSYKNLITDQIFNIKRKLLWRYVDVMHILNLTWLYMSI